MNPYSGLDRVGKGVESGLSRREALRLSALALGSLAIGCGTDSDDAPVSEAALGTDAVGYAPGLGAPRFVDTNGIRMAVYEQGEGVPVVFCHGFPELAFSWRHQVPAVAEAGYRAIAPDQRGYGLTKGPEAMDQYTLLQLCGDMAGMLDALEIDKAVFCGHDWGGGVVWMMPRLHPDRVLGVIGVNTPTSHPAHQREPTEQSLIVRSERYYTNTFQPLGDAEAVLEADVKKTFEFFMRRGGIWNVEAFAALPEDSPERRLDLLTMVQAGSPTGEMFLTDEELKFFVDSFERTGFTGGLNWYRAARLPGLAEAISDWDIHVPSLYVGAENDVILRPSSSDGMVDFIADFERHTVADCGHWTQQEKPEELNRVILDWLARKFPNQQTA